MKQKNLYNENIYSRLAESEQKHEELKKSLQQYADNDPTVLKAKVKIIFF